MHRVINYHSVALSPTSTPVHTSHRVLQSADWDASQTELKATHATLNARSGELGESRAEVRHLKDVIAAKTEEISRNIATIAQLHEAVAGKVAEVERVASGAL